MKKNGKLGTSPIEVSHNEYNANLNRMNIFFGAVLGVVMGGASDQNGFQYGALLAFLARFVVTIMYISASKQRMTYSLYALGMLGALWAIVFLDDTFFGIQYDWFVSRLLPPLLVWTLMTMLIEFGARETEETPAG